MSPIIRIDEDVMDELKRKAIELNMVFDTPNEVLKVILGCTSPIKKINNANFPRSTNHNVQKLLDGLHDTILNISPNGLTLSKSRRWIAIPNTVTITVQEKIAKNLAITIYGNPEDYNHINHNLDIKQDRKSYSGFHVDKNEQLSSAIEVIKYSYQLKANKKQR